VRRAAVAALVIAVAAVAAGSASAAGSRDLAAATFLSPTNLLFGDHVTAELEVLADSARVDPNSVRIKTRFAPFEVVGRPQRERHEANGMVAFRFRYHLVCVTHDCLPAIQHPRGFRLGRAVVSARRRDGTLAVVAPSWPAMEVSTRVTAIDLATSNWRVRDYPFPAISYRVRPSLLGGLLDAAAALLVLGGLALLARPVLARVPRFWRKDELAGLVAVERALALLRRARRTGEAEEQRKALDLLALELRRRGDAELARGARRLAWSELGPAADEVDSFAGRVEQTLETS
jgi:hypothetical protein